MLSHPGCQIEKLCLPCRWTVPGSWTHALTHHYSKHNKTNNKATEARECRICSLYRDARWIHWSLVPERIAGKRRSLRGAISPNTQRRQRHAEPSLRFKYTGHVPTLRAVSTVHSGVHEGDMANTRIHRSLPQYKGEVPIWRIDIFQNI